jgi:hypothetical protein
MRAIMIATILLSLTVWTALPAADAAKGTWQPISDGILGQLATAGAKVGYPGASAGVACDAASGEVFVVICDQGLWRSADHGATFARVDQQRIGGRCETGFALDGDPAGRRLMAFMIYGDSALSSDGGATWRKSTLSHLDFGAVDWSGPQATTMIAVKHESGDEAVLTRDAGTTWTSLGKGFKQIGIFPDGVLMAGKGQGLLRSEDGGATWTAVAAFRPAGLAMRVHAGVGYWTSDAGVQVSRDQGRTWTLLGTPVKAYYGPYFSADERHLVVVGSAGLSETVDAGATWQVVAPLPEGYRVGFTGPNFAWDAKAGIFYASTMGKPALRFVR